MAELTDVIETNLLQIGERIFEVWEISLLKGEIVAEVIDVKDDDKYLKNLFIMDQDDAETMAEQNDELSGFTDEMGRDGEHITVDFYIPFDVYFQDTTHDDRLSMYKKEITEAITQAIKDNKI